MTGWMEQDPIVEGVRPTVGPVNEVVVFPTGFLGDFAPADRTQAVLSSPQMYERASTAPMGHHFGVQTFLEVLFPLGVKGISCGPDFDVSFDADFGRLDQALGSLRAVLFLQTPIEAGALSVFGSKVFGVNPAIAFVIVPPFGPAPQSLIYLVINVDKGLLADYVAMVVGPAPNNGVEFGDQLPGGQM